MNEVHDFMSKFGKDVETKWGLYIDESLEEQVKFTVLATGFGIQDIHMKEMDDRITQRTAEEQKRLAELEEEEEQRRSTPRNLLRKGCQHQVSASAPPAYLYLQP